MTAIGAAPTRAALRLCWWLEPRPGARAREPKQKDAGTNAEPHPPMLRRTALEMKPLPHARELAVACGRGSPESMNAQT
jgi:hypothetical protein